MSALEFGILLLFAVIGFADPAAAASMKKDLSRVTANKTLDLVSVLKEDLRKNNDDYKDIREPVKQKINNPYLRSDDAVNSEENKGGNDIDFARRNFNKRQKAQDKKNSRDINTKAPNKDAKPHDKQMLHDKNVKTDDEIESGKKTIKSNQKITKSNDKKYMSQNKNLKTDDETIKVKNGKTTKFNDKNSMLHDKNMKGDDKNLKSRLQDTKWADVHDLKGERAKKYQRNEVKTTAGSVTSKTVLQDGRRSRLQADKLHNLLDREGLLNKFLRNAPGARGRGKGKSDGEVRNRAIAFEIESDVDAPPPPDTIPSTELDMLPATGERIETLRRKGRLCFRHILFPEGPKYDSKGRIYEPAHADKVSHRNFEHTRAPRMILPKCCNCCKKSVLGCE